MRRHSYAGLALSLAGLLVLAVGACGSSDDTTTGNAAAGPGGAGGVSAGGAGTGGNGGALAGGQGGVGAAGGAGTGGAQAGAGGGGGTAPARTQALFFVPSAPDSLGVSPSRDGLVSNRTGKPYPDFWDHPWPSDWRRDPDGRIRTKGYPNPNSSSLIQEYVDAADRMVDGFSPQAAGYVRFTGSIDPSTLPSDPKASLDKTSSLQLIDIDDASPEKGTRKLFTSLYRDVEGVYWQPHTLSWIPEFGYPLRPHTRYAFVVTNAVKTPAHEDLAVAPEIAAALGIGPDVDGEPTAALRSSWAGAVTALTQADVDIAKIVHFTVFTTTGPTDELFAIRDDIHKNFPAPKAHDADWAAKEQTAQYDTYEGNYGPSPDYQAGNIPFQVPADGGGFAFDASGNPIVQRMFDLRFALTIPKAPACPMPAAGYPIVLYAHGTGGDYRSYIDDGTAAALASQCVAAMGIDQIFHGTRPGAPPDGPGKEMAIELLFFNFQNPLAIRTNGRQGAVDEVQRARLFTESGTSVPASVSRTKSQILLDGTKLMFFGHSQGGLNGPLYLACDDSARGGVLSGSGSIISISLLEKTKPTPSVAELVKTLLLGLKPASFEELGPLHPTISLAQTIVDALDPIHYVSHLAVSPRPGFAPKSIYQTEGVNPDSTGDSYTPPHSIEVQAVATGLPLMNPVIHPVKEMAFGSPAPVTIPAEGLSGNLAGGLASGVLAQWTGWPATSDGHFVVFDVPAARAQAAKFCKNLADDPHGRVPAP